MTSRHELKILPGTPYPMGVSLTNDGKVNFAAALHTREECGVLLYLHAAGKPVRIPFTEKNRIGNIYCMQAEGLADTKFQYNFYAGEEIITDPYADVIYGNERWGRQTDPKLRGGFSRHTYDWENDAPLMTPLSETILYLVHPRGFTRHASSGVEHKGTFAGIVEKIPYLKELGITAVELMPSYEFLELEKPECREMSMEDAVNHYRDLPAGEEEAPRINYWGYKKGYYFAPKMSYSSSDCPAEEFKDMVKKLHQNGIEVIMQFYFPVDVKRAYILEVIKYWVFSCHVDGFHLLGVHIPTALLATEPMLGNTKLFYTDFSCDEIYDNSDIPAYKNLAVYNDDFMYAVRHFLKSDEGSLLPALGSLRKNPRQTGVINYVTNYSGFTLADLVSYDRKHNEDNGEENRDGENYNVSWNCGFEGRTRKKSVQELRGRQMKNAMLLLLTSQGTPMIVSGDEFGFSHGGNNNPYCQDNGVSWLNWRLQETNQEFFSFVKQAIAYRKKHPVLHRPDELAMMDYIACGYPDLSYHGEEAWKLKADNLSRQAGLMYCGCYAKTDRKNDDNFIYIAYNMHWEEHDFALPSLPAGLKWTRVLDTAAKENGVQDENGETAAVKGRSVQILESREKTEKEKQKAGRKKK